MFVVSWYGGALYGHMKVVADYASVLGLATLLEANLTIFMVHRFSDGHLLSQEDFDQIGFTHWK